MLQVLNAPPFQTALLFNQLLITIFLQLPLWLIFDVLLNPNGPLLVASPTSWHLFPFAALQVLLRSKPSYVLQLPPVRSIIILHQLLYNILVCWPLWITSWLSSFVVMASRLTQLSSRGVSSTLVRPIFKFQGILRMRVFKTVYVCFELLVLPLRVPWWFVSSIRRDQRPLPSWSLPKAVAVRSLRRLQKVNDRCDSYYFLLPSHSNVYLTE